MALDSYCNGNTIAGILNAVDYVEWNPEDDSHIAAKYSAKDLGGKAKCKADLLREFRARKS